MSLYLEHLWPQVLTKVQHSLPKPSFETWIKPTRPVAMHDGKVILGAPNQITLERLKTRYRGVLADAFRNVLGRDVHLQFIIPEGQPSQAAPPSIPEASPENPPDPDSGYSPAVPFSMGGTSLNHRYTFDTFVVGSSNRFAHAAALAVAEAPARAYNPLFLYGGVGLGKTHLMHAVGHFVLRRDPTIRVVYISSETFTNQLINAIRDHKTVEFRTRYRNVDILLLDDVQFLAGKEASQEEFFHTFDALHAASKQIVISSDRPPKEIATLEDRLRSRFEWGLITDIQPPDLETRIAILKKKAQLDGATMPEEVIEFIAAQFDSNIRELEGALIRVIAYSSHQRQPITLDLAKRALHDMLGPAKRRQITISLIQEVVSNFYAISVDDLKAKRRTRAVALPRQVAMFLCRELTKASLPKIGEEFGGRDHTTVLHACDKVMQEMQADRTFEATIRQLMERLRSEPYR